MSGKLGAVFALMLGVLPAAAAERAPEEFPAKGLKLIKIFSDGCSVTVSASSGPAVRLEVSNDDPRYCVITGRVSGAEFRLDARTVKGVGEQGKTCQAAVSVYAPAGLSLDLENRLGGVAVNGMSGRVSVDSRMGQVAVSGLTGDVSIVSKMGGVSGDACSGLVDVKASMGKVDLSGLCGAAKVDAGQGKVTLAWKNVPAAGAAEIRSRMGGVRLSFPAGSAIDLDLKAGMGRVHSEFEDKAGGFPVIVRSDMGGIEVVKK